MARTTKYNIYYQDDYTKDADVLDDNKKTAESVEDALETIDGKADTNASNIETLQGNVQTNTDNISTNAANIATNTTNIATNTADISTLNGKVQTNTSNIATNTANIAANAGNIAANTAAIGGKVDKVTGKSLVDDGTISWLTTVEEFYDSDTIEKGIANFFALTQDDGVYTVKFPLWDTSNTCAGEKLDKNIGKYLNLATDTTYEDTNYGEAFKTYDCNAYVDSNGVRHITALKGMDNFKDTGKVDVFVLIRTYYEKWYEKDGYMYYSRTYTPKEGFTPVSQAINKDGTINPWFLIAKYAAGIIVDNNVRKPYSSKGLKPARHISNPTGACAGQSDNICYNDDITIFKRRGTYYTAGLMADYKHIKTTIWLKFATKNSQSVIKGNTENNFQYAVSQTESNVSRVIVTTAQAANFDLHTFVSVGDKGTQSSIDRHAGYMNNLADDVEIIGKEVIDSSNTALILDCDPFTTTSTTYVSTMHEHSGYSDYVLGRNGSRISNTNGKHGAVIDGIECFVGGYEVPANAFMDIVDGLTRDIYVTNDATKLTTNVTTAKSTYKKVANQITTTANNAWKYITEEKMDLVNGVSYSTKSGQTGSGSATGYADGYYADTGTSGQREFLLLGSLSSGANAGVSILGGSLGLGNANWYVLARLSINAVGGELAA